ncbi:FAD/NAD-binding domain-containing protein [Fomitiporia mediterranea MF3/22]|uniref:FAD/NAD-binding domain-containing protein n=1 Tax=Fomitiporia mediterranea (strain MF3/22) TaxID=694068 RepID=UPI0004409472|nr:FAD/NAD-binding domain-containing protein [Fomitiporia mediterranea MF3/22]EJD00658.1 FAD/NAD-binding domain-containing protein [Fomitiporia mediterranea MF3/22]
MQKTSGSSVIADAIPTERPHIYGGRQSSHLLHILIIGCGLGGIAAAHTLSQAGHTITILESAREIGEVGVGVVLPPPITRLLAKWGAGEALRRVGVRSEGMAHLRYADGTVLGYMPMGERMEKRFGAPNMFLHRADFHKILSSLALSSPLVTLRLRSPVEDIQPIPSSEDGKVSVRLAGGEVVKGDLVIGADGIKSLTRSLIVRDDEKPEATGDATYRVILPTELMSKDEELKKLVEKGDLTVWVGEGTHMVGYPMSGGKQYNLGFIHPDDDAIESWVAPGDVKTMREQFAKYEPRCQKILSLIENPVKWRLMDHKPLRQWMHPAGRVVLLGDACHPMLPYLAAGAAMAVEDAAVLGNLLSHLTSPNQLPYFLSTYQLLRAERAWAAQLGSRAMQGPFHIHDGPEQEERDKGMQKRMNEEWGVDEDGDVKDEGREGKVKVKYEMMFGYDPDREVDEWWEREGRVFLQVPSDKVFDLLE